MPAGRLEEIRNLFFEYARASCGPLVHPDVALVLRGVHTEEVAPEGDDGSEPDEFASVAVPQVMEEIVYFIQLAPRERIQDPFVEHVAASANGVDIVLPVDFVLYF